jgi:tetratricopeptide repeat protein
MGRLVEEERLLAGAVGILTKVAGRAARSTIQAISQLAQCHEDQGQYTEAEKLRKKILLLNQEKHGEQHLNTMETISGQPAKQTNYRQ